MEPQPTRAIYTIGSRDLNATLDKGVNGMKMRNLAVKFLIVSGVLAAYPVLAQQAEPHPTCNHCSATYVPKSELDAYNQRAMEHNLVDQQVRLVDIGKMQVGIGSIYRGKLGQAKGEENIVAEAVAEHEQVSEVYYVIDGSATLLTGPDIVGAKPRPSTLKTVREQNGPGFSGTSINNPVVHELKAGDMIVIPAGTGHWFTKIDDHIRYVMVRLDPDKILPLKNEAQSQKYLASPYSPNQGNF
jgi:mannose-6-phosphate isomerase-like protein (cupin superfamily)